ncbi:DNA-binding domain-containing protein [uncultured Roseovarius sp.]|uniref:HvfC/BufC N-terminal domain-containing protein n=1 Tax=uncultured Roseovarius sp. TaxID=293344 RepID=UPI0025FD709E|nr:DNA-binding domain-containing protein [uncultured Roseovarius sp.]
MSVSQTQFHDALLDSSTSVPIGLSDGRGQPAGARFSVYRNNVAVSLTEALEVSFPAILSLIGHENFKKTAGLFLRQHPPKNPMIMVYGDEFPSFLEDFEPLQHIAYLPDVARLEQALRESYHAADADAVAPNELAILPQEALAASKLILAPSLRLVRSRWPIHAIWSYALDRSSAKPKNQGQDVLITRPAYDPEGRVLPPGASLFVANILEGKTLGDAYEKAMHDAPEFDLTGLLTMLLDTSSIIEIQTQD